jgi:glycosyltransferase involved in cell wall biosynthesis
MELNAQLGRRFEFHFLGAKAPNFKPEATEGIYHGPYERERLPELLRQVKPSFSLIASVCPETFCYTLSESWAAGLPVFASNLGALQERITRSGGGWLLDPKDPSRWFAEMIRVLDNPVEYHRKMQEVLTLDLKSVNQMATEYEQVYEQTSGLSFKSSGSQPERDSLSCQPEPLPSSSLAESPLNGKLRLTQQGI